MSVVVDAESQRVTAKLPATPQGDADLIAYLRTGQLPGDSEGKLALAEREQRARTDPASTLRRLLDQNRAEQRSAAGRISELKAQERDLLRLLEAAGKGQ